MNTLQKLTLSLIFLLIVGGQQFAQQPSKSQIEIITNKHLNNSYTELYQFLSIPNDAHYPEQIKANISWIKDAFDKRNFKTSILKSAGNSLLFAESIVDNSMKTVLFYFHLDGQPVDISKWDQENPYKPELKKRNISGNWEIIDWNLLNEKPDVEFRIFARSSSDDKSPIIMLLTAIDAIHSIGLNPSFNIKVILDGEEEMGSPNLPAVVEENKALLSADMMVIFDGPRHITNRPSIFYGCRGLVALELKVFGPRVAQHSGHYGNYAPNPALNLSQLLASMKDKSGKVIIPGFYDGIKMDEKIKKILSEVPDDLALINANLGIAVPDKVGADYQQSLQYPSLNIRGMLSGWVGKEARTIVPSDAVANLDIRLVVESDPMHLINLVKKHIEDQGFQLVDNPPNDMERMNYPKIAMLKYAYENLAFRTEFDSEVGQWIERSLIRAFNEQPVRVRTTGGTVPISQFINKLKIEAVILPLVNLDNNQHSQNENLRLGNYQDGIKTFISLLTEEI